MRTIAIIEFWLLIILLIVLLIIFSLCNKKHKENENLKIELMKAKSEIDYQKKMMDLKEESYRNAKEKNKKLDTGTKRERISAAGDVLCND